MGCRLQLSTFLKSRKPLQTSCLTSCPRDISCSKLKVGVLLPLSRSFSLSSFSFCFCFCFVLRTSSTMAPSSPTQALPRGPMRPPMHVSQSEFPHRNPPSPHMSSPFCGHRISRLQIATTSQYAKRTHKKASPPVITTPTISIALLWKTRPTANVDVHMAAFGKMNEYHVMPKLRPPLCPMQLQCAPHETMKNQIARPQSQSADQLAITWRIKPATCC